MPYRQFLLHLGHVEDQSLVQLPMSHLDGFATPLEAMQDLKRILISHVKTEPKPCCAKASKDKEARFCKTCGERLLTDPQLEQEDLEGLAAAEFERMFSMTIDSSASGIWELFAREGWEFSLSDPTEIVVTVVSVNRWLSEGEGTYMGWSSSKGEGSTFG